MAAFARLGELVTSAADDNFAAMEPTIALPVLTSRPLPRFAMMEYQSILGAEISVEACETLTSGDLEDLSCEVHYSNAMNRAVGKPPAVTVKEFSVMIDALLLERGGEQVWYEDNYPEDTELRDSFQRFADSGDLKDEYAESGCATSRTENCGNLILDNIDDWAAWYETNG